MIKIDGAQGEGGGQILRSSVALSAITGKPVTVTNIRAGRKKSGLKRQHVTAVRAAARLCNAELDGVEPGSSELTFRPSDIVGGDVQFQMGTAGSTTLVLQTVLPILLHADAPSTVTLEGGTHNPFAPPFDFLQKAYLPQLAKMGANVKATLHRAGFYPAGGGRLEVNVQPLTAFEPLELMDRGKLVKRRVRALVSNLPDSIGKRECDVIRRKFQWTEECCTVEEVDSPGPGNVIFVELHFENVTEVFVAFGQKQRRAEQVARDLARQVKRYISSEVPVGEYLADQLMLPMALGQAKGTGGGQYRTFPLSDHSTTHINIIREFLSVEIDVREVSDRECVVVVK